MLDNISKEMNGNYQKMTEIEMLDCLKNIVMNFSWYGDQEIYSQILWLLDEMVQFMKTELEVDYPLEYYIKDEQELFEIRHTSGEPFVF